MRLRLPAFAVLLALSAPAAAERLVFDHRLSPPLKAVLDSGDGAMVHFDGSNPRNIVDVIAVRGKSAADWKEALLIIARSKAKKVKDAPSWQEELRRDALRKCPATFEPLAQDANSITFARTSQGCPADYPVDAIYRVVAGKTSLFLLAVMAKDSISPAARAEWIALLGSARLE